MIPDAFWIVDIPLSQWSVYLHSTYWAPPLPHSISLVNIFICLLVVLIVSVFFCSVYRSCNCLQVGSWTTHVNLTVRCKNGVSMGCSGWLCLHWGKSSHMRNFHMTTTSRCLTQLRDRYSFRSVRKLCHSYLPAVSYFPVSQNRIVRNCCILPFIFQV